MAAAFARTCGHDGMNLVAKEFVAARDLADAARLRRRDRLSTRLSPGLRAVAEPKG